MKSEVLQDDSVPWLAQQAEGISTDNLIFICDDKNQIAISEYLILNA